MLDGWECHWLLGVSVSRVGVLGSSCKVVMQVMKMMKVKTSIRHQSPMDVTGQSLLAHWGFRQLSLFSERLSALIDKGRSFSKFKCHASL